MNSTSAWTWTGAAFVPCDSVPLADRGFRYGMSVFESFPVHGKIPLFLAGHYARLQKSCEISGLQAALPAIDDFEKLLHELPFDGFVRIYVTAGEGSVADGSEHGSVFVFAEPLVAPAHDACKIIFHREPHAPVFGGLKTANYWPNVAALQKARKNQCDEALLLNTRGDLISASMANVFIVQGGKIKTPAAESGAREGVVREWVMRRRPVSQGRITETDLARADEIFLTNSRSGVMPVASLEGRPLPSREAALQLRVEYEREISEVAGGG